MRGWATSNPAENTAFYRFRMLEAAKAAAGLDAIKAPVATFDRCWPQANRTRDVVEIAEGTSPA